MSDEPRPAEEQPTIKESLTVQTNGAQGAVSEPIAWHVNYGEGCATCVMSKDVAIHCSGKGAKVTPLFPDQTAEIEAIKARLNAALHPNGDGPKSPAWCDTIKYVQGQQGEIERLRAELNSLTSQHDLTRQEAEVVELERNGLRAEVERLMLQDARSCEIGTEAIMECDQLRERVKALEEGLRNCRDFIELRKTHSGTVESWRRSVLDEVSKLLQPAKGAE